MNKCVRIAAAAILGVWTASAQQDGQKVGVFLGYDYVRFNSATNAAAFSANGGNGEFTFKFNNTIGVVADLGAVHNNNMNGIHADTTIANFLFGPKLTLLGHRSRFKPYFQVLLGGVYTTSSAQILGTLVDPSIPGQPITARVGASQTAFAM